MGTKAKFIACLETSDLDGLCECLLDEAFNPVQMGAWGKHPNGRMPIHIAAQLSSPEIVQMLVKHNAPLDQTGDKVTAVRRIAPGYL